MWTEVEPGVRIEVESQNTFSYSDRNLPQWSPNIKQVW